LASGFGSAEGFQLQVLLVGCDSRESQAELGLPNLPPPAGHGGIPQLFLAAS